MNYHEALGKLNELKDCFYKFHWDNSLSAEAREELRERIPILYGELEELYIKMVGIHQVETKGGRGQTAVYQNYLEAAVLSPWTYWLDEGYKELLKVIGKVQRLANNPTPIRNEQSVTQLIQILRRFRECCQYIKDPPSDEKDVQDIMWIMLRSQFDRLDREDTLPKFGVKSYKPDFGIPDLQVLIEAKFISEKTSVPRIQEEILADVPAYLNESSNYISLVILVYDSGHKLLDSRKFIEDLKSVEGIIEVIVIPGIG